MTSFLVMLESILDLGAIQPWVMVVQAVSGVALSSYMDLKLDTFFFVAYSHNFFATLTQANIIGMANCSLNGWWLGLYTNLYSGCLALL